MGLFNPTVFKWTEPTVVRRSVDALRTSPSAWKIRCRTMLAIAALYVCVLWLPRYLIWRHHPHLFPHAPVGPLVAVMASLLLGAFLAYGVPMMLWLCPSYIRITQTGLCKIIGNTAKPTLFKDMRSFNIQKIDGITTLFISLDAGKNEIIGVADQVDAEALSAYLTAHIQRIDGLDAPRDA